LSDGAPHLSIIVPAYNEAQRILPSLETLAAFIQNQSYKSEVIVVDDCSTDETNEIVREFIARHAHFKLERNEINRGKGASVKRGMQIARGHYRLFSDADLSTPIDEVTKFLSLIEAGADVIIGSRRVSGARLVKRQPVHREASGRIFSLLVRMVTLGGFLDTQCGFKLFTAHAAEKIFPKMTIERFGFDVEILFIAQRLGFKIKEAPVTWIDSPASQVRLFRDSIHMFADLFRIRRNALSGRYN
jgi:dolichyl-phosphate beta-glucosyltransferase